VGASASQYNNFLGDNFRWRHVKIYS